MTTPAEAAEADTETLVGTETAAGILRSFSTSCR